MKEKLELPDHDRILSAQELLAGSRIIHEIQIPMEVVQPSSNSGAGAVAGKVRLRPLSLAVLTVISRAARDDAALVPLLMIKESLVEPNLSVDQIRQMHVGLAHFLVNHINKLSGLSADGEALNDAIDTPISQAHILLARHFGWTPEQVSQLTPGQVTVYLAGIEKLSAQETGQ